MNEIEQLRLELAEARNQLEKYRQLEWTCYEALGYAEPTNDALPFLISKEREDRIGLEKQIKSALDKLDAAERAGAEMREALEMWRPVREQILTKTNTTKAFDHALSSDHGKGWLLPEQVKPLVDALRLIVKHFPNLQLNGLVADAIVHAKELGL